MSAESSGGVECPKCGTVSKSGDRFCRGCGGDLTPQPVQAAAVSSGGGDIETPGASRLLWVLAGVLVVVGIFVVGVLALQNSDPESDVAAGVSETTAPVASADTTEGTSSSTTTTSGAVETTLTPTTEAPAPTVTEAPAPTVTVPTPDVLFPVRVDGLFGFIDSSGSLVVDAKYEDAGVFAEGFAPVKTAEGWGYINTSGAWAIDPQFKWAGEFGEGLAPAMADNGLVGAVDSVGSWAIDPTFDWILPFTEGLAAAEVEMTWGYLNTSGKWAIEPRFWLAFPFSEDMAATETAEGWGLVGTDGEWGVIPEISGLRPFSDGLAAISITVNGGELWGYVDLDRNERIALQFARAGEFSDGLAPVQTEDGLGYIDSTGTLVVPAVYAFTMPFRDGLAKVSFSPDTEEGPPLEFGYIDTSGAWVWEPTS